MGNKTASRIWCLLLVLCLARLLGAQSKVDAVGGARMPIKLPGFRPAPNPDPKLPRVLLIGDSICSGYLRIVRDMLKGKANVDAWVTGANVKWIGDRLRKTLKQGKYEAIHFNIGLHGLGNRIAPDDYEPLFRKYVKTMVDFSRGATLIWASTTPMRTRETTTFHPVENPKIVRRNAIAAKVAKANGILIDDLYGLAIKHLDLGGKDGVHWKRPAYALMGEQIAAMIEKGLGSGRNR